MVRIIAGTLIQVGKGKFNPEYVKEMLDAKDRTQAGQTAPPQGLTLMRVSVILDICNCDNLIHSLYF